MICKCPWGEKKIEKSDDNTTSQSVTEDTSCPREGQKELEQKHIMQG